MKVEELRKMAGTLADVLPIEILPEIDRQELAGHMALRQFKQGEVVYHQGDPAAHWFVVFEGLVKVLLLDENGRELLISLHSRGEFFGERVIFRGKGSARRHGSLRHPDTRLPDRPRRLARRVEAQRGSAATHVRAPLPQHPQARGPG